MELSNEVFSAPFQLLMDEHRLLRADMEDFNEIAEDIEIDAGPDVRQLFAVLYEKISAFAKRLEAHSNREEKSLFAFVIRHPKGDPRTIKMLEFEHEKSEGHIRDFLAEGEQAGSAISADDAQGIIVHAIQAYTTLTQHFAKEEKILFPLAENILSVDEKDELVRLLQTL